MAHTGAWKGFEYRVAEFFGGRRSAFSGARPGLTGTSSDVMHPFLYVESKWRAKHSLMSLWRSTKRKADTEKKIPVICLHEKNTEGFIIALHSSDIDRLSDYGRTDDLPLFKNTEN